MPFDFMLNKVVGIAGRGAAERDGAVIQVGGQVFRLGDKARRDREKGMLLATQKVPVRAPVVGTPLYLAPSPRARVIPPGLGGVLTTPDQSWWDRAYNWGASTAAGAAAALGISEGALETTGDVIATRLSQVRAAAEAGARALAGAAGEAAAAGARRKADTAITTYLIIAAVAAAVYYGVIRKGRRR